MGRFQPIAVMNKVLNILERKAGRTRLISRPTELTIEPTLQCNSNCLMCNRNFSRKDDKRAEGFLSWETFNKTAPFWLFARRVLFSGFGEPLLHPDYLEMLLAMKRRGVYVSMYSNGVLLNEKLGRGIVEAGMDKIYISMGGATRETYQKIRGIDAFEIVVQNLKALKTYKKKRGTRLPRVAFNVVAMNSVMNEIEGLLQMAKELGVEELAMPNLVVQGESLRHESIWLDCKKNQETINKAARRAEQLNIRFLPPVLQEREGFCWDIFSKLNINWDGSVMSCALERFFLGDLRKQELADIWNSAGLVNLRKEFLKGGVRKHCPNCACWKVTPDSFLNPWINARDHADKV